MKYLSILICLYSMCVHASTLHLQNNFAQTSSSNTCGVPCQKFFINNQEDADNFKLEYGQCTAFAGSILIDSDKVDNLEGLSNLNSISGDLLITDTVDLTSLKDLKNLTSIGGSLDLEANQALSGLDGLQQLTDFQSLILVGNNILKDISPLKVSNVATMGFISNNPLLRNVTSATAALSKDASNLFQVNNSPTLTTIGLLTSSDGVFNGDMSLDNDDDIKQSDFLSQFKKINGHFGLFDMKNLASLDGFKSLTDINGRLIIDNLAKLTNLDGLQNINPHFSGQLGIYDNSNLVDCKALCPLIANKKHIELTGNNSKCIESLSQCS
ncbi:hypothetical protein D5018_02265 [Parashewanella curva]|uniref:Receptor L-domain domain-containing protein n=1 Tax=Parashewanella curva TaxID=2338552 RepID=A0A3L8Q2Y6_9GAMM|nr:hypothetical protein [Parashewanella curva]RLV61323.1 hypothetical protein D5018_02265 [Parashewanella curva]